MSYSYVAFYYSVAPRVRCWCLLPDSNDRARLPVSGGGKQAVFYTRCSNKEGHPPLKTDASW